MACLFPLGVSAAELLLTLPVQYVDVATRDRSSIGYYAPGTIDGYKRYLDCFPTLFIANEHFSI